MLAEHDQSYPLVVLKMGIFDFFQNPCQIRLKLNLLNFAALFWYGNLVSRRRSG